MKSPSEVGAIPGVDGVYAARRRSIGVQVGEVQIGGDAPVVVQAMTDTDTADEVATAIQCAELARAGAQVVRVAVNTPRAAAAVPGIAARLRNMECAVPLAGDFHYNGHKLLRQFPQCARTLAKYRINPGNVGRGDKRDKQFAMMIETALEYGKAVRIGVNWGSVDQELLARLMDANGKCSAPLPANAVLREALVQSALASAAAAQKMGMPPECIIISCKTSRIPDLLAVCRRLAAECDYALHIGLTEAGMGLRGVGATSAALALLLGEGIGDTIRASLTPFPGASRTEEAKLCCELLQAMGLRDFSPQVAACPGCGRTTSDFFRRLAGDIESHIAQKLPQWKARYRGVESMKIAVMGCVVNGPGESRHADIGISLPGSGERPVAPVFVDGEKVAALSGDAIAADFLRMLEDYIHRRYG